MTKDIAGKFSMTLKGWPLLMKANGALRSDAGCVVLLKGLVLGPVVIGLVKPD